MNTTEFYKKLVEKPTRVHFFLENGQIRGRLKKGSRRGQTVCPITLVAYAVTGKFFNEYEYHQAARSIKLHKREAYKIVEASDYSSCYPKVREKLLKVTKLKAK
jgi:hypothetical protein